MKRIASSLIIALAATYCCAQITIRGKHTRLQTVPGIDHVVCFATIDNTAEIHFRAPHPDAQVEWFTFGNGKITPLTNYSQISPNTTYIDPRHNTGYIITVDGQRAAVCWTIDLSATTNPQQIAIETPEGIRTTLAQAQPAQKPKNTPKTPQYNPTNTTIQHTPPHAPADTIGCKITTNTQPRDSTNENQRPKETTIEGSAPLSINFYSNPVGNVNHFLWQIYKDGQLVATRTEQDHHYLFQQTGKYKVRLQVTNTTLTAADSIDVAVVESAIAVPKIFTPNADGFNDEFRVAYTSIVQFNATIFNRWGRQVYQWTNPQTGWNGTINGKPAPEGTYFYLIRAQGAEGKTYTLKGHINLLR